MNEYIICSYFYNNIFYIIEKKPYYVISINDIIILVFNF